jgi:hypothetical protein
MRHIDPSLATTASGSPLVNRRGFLRGAAGVALTLPLLESLPLRAEETGKLAASAATTPPLRFGFVYFSNGVEPEHWWAREAGGQIEYGPGLAAMQPHSKDITFLRGLYNENAARSRHGDHMGKMANMLSGGFVSSDQNVINVGKTMDQVLSQKLGGQTEIPSLIVGIEPTEMRLEDGLSMIYGSCVSWATDSKPATKEIYPARVYDLLVGGGSRQLDRSILDSVLGDANALKVRLGGADVAKLDEYLDSIRDIEQRIDRASREERIEGWRPTLAQPDMPRPNNELPQNVPEHMKLMLDLVVLAFQMDKTRITTCMLNNDLSQMNFAFLEGVRGALHLDLTHNGRTAEGEAMYLKTNQFHSEQCAYLVQRLKDIDEGGTSLLDNSMILMGSNLFDGDRHQADHMPLLLAGRAGGRLETGRILDYYNEIDENRRACSLYLSLMDRMGVSLPRFGDSDKRLANV